MRKAIWEINRESKQAECSKCKREAVYQAVDGVWRYENFCPHCGAEMLNAPPLTAIKQNHIERGVLFSIRPEYCEHIISGKKTIEVRRKFPRCKVPFKGYIYCTLGGRGMLYGNRGDEKIQLNGKVIGEFTCDSVVSLPNKDAQGEEFEKILEAACLDEDKFFEYSEHETVYLLGIKDFTLYKYPRYLEEDFGFNKPPLYWCYVGDRVGSRTDQRALRSTASRRERRH